jgi:hypothetical protein
MPNAIASDLPYSGRVCGFPAVRREEKFAAGRKKVDDQNA